MALAMRQAGEAVSRVVDSAIHTEAISGFTGTLQNDPAATGQTDDLALGDIVGGYVALNSSDVPATDRAWVFHPSAYGELLKISGNYFTSFDFRQGRPLENGMIGQMLGSPVYQSTNVGTASDGSPAETTLQNLYFHRDALGVAMQHTPEVESAYDIDTQGILGNVRAGYGLKTLRGDHGLIVQSMND